MPHHLLTNVQKFFAKVFLALWLATLPPLMVAVQMVGADNTPHFPTLIQESRFVAFTPRSFSVNKGKVVPASRPGIRKDLEILRPYFDGLITYSANNGVEEVAELANELDYQAVIMGIWDPTSDIEITNVLRTYREYPKLLAAVIVGNEGIYAKRYTHKDVQLAMQRLKKDAPNLAVTTSEPFFIYFTPDHAEFFKSHDLLMPNIHPVFEKWFMPNELEHGVTMVLDVAKKLQGAYQLPVLIKETGLPSGKTDQGYLPARQAQFWNELSKRFQGSTTMAFAYFEAFDTPWKPALMASEFPGNHDNEAYWGLFTTTGKPKEVVKFLPRPSQIKP